MIFVSILKRFFCISNRVHGPNEDTTSKKDYILTCRGVNVVKDIVFRSVRFIDAKILTDVAPNLFHV